MFSDSRESTLAGPLAVVEAGRAGSWCLVKKH